MSMLTKRRFVVLLVQRQLVALGYLNPDYPADGEAGPVLETALDIAFGDYENGRLRFDTPTIAAQVVAMFKSTQEAQIEAAAKALFASQEPDRNAWRWDRPNPNTPDDPFAWHGYWLDAARTALEAAYLVAFRTEGSI